MFDINPYSGTRIRLVEDYSACGFTEAQAQNILWQIASSQGEDLLLESISFPEYEETFYTGEPVSNNFILESIIIKQYAKTDKKLLSLAKSMNNKLPPELKIDLRNGIVIGKPKKKASFAYVKTMLQLGDGQTVSILFHALEGDQNDLEGGASKSKITSNSTLISYHWLLNKADITAQVTPKDGEEISVSEIASRVAQLAKTNSAKFTAKAAKRSAEVQELQEVERNLAALEKQKEDMTNVSLDVAKEHGDKQQELIMLNKQLEKLLSGNTQLETAVFGLQQAAKAERNRAGVSNFLNRIPEGEEDPTDLRGASEQFDPIYKRASAKQQEELKRKQEEEKRKAAERAKREQERQAEEERKRQEEAAKQTNTETQGDPIMDELNKIASGIYDSEGYKAVKERFRPLAIAITKQGKDDEYKKEANAVVKHIADMMKKAHEGKY